MTVIKCWWLLCFYLLVSPFGESTPLTDSLRFVHVVWRHGDRTPAHVTFPTDTQNGPETWPEGIGELTTIGMRQQYELGAFLRRRYIDTKFLSPEYNASEIYVRSSDFNRTIASALVNMAAFYPPSVDCRFNHGLPWRPIPVHSVPIMQDYVIISDRPCAAVSKVYHEEISKSESIMRIEWQNSEFMQFVRNGTGLPLPSFMKIAPVFDVLNCEKIHNRTWPAWVTPAVFERIKHLFEAALSAELEHPIVRRLKGGPLFREIALRSLAKASKTIRPPSLKYYAYSGHDFTLVALLKNLGAHDGRLAEYASAILIELHEKTSGKFIIKVFYLNETGSEKLIPIVVKDCGMECDLDTFVDWAHHNTPANWSVECGSAYPDSNSYTTNAGGIIENVCLLIMCVVCTLILCIQGMDKYP